MPELLDGQAGEKLLAEINTLVQEVETTLSNLVGDSSLCLIGKSGRPANAVKYAEGKYHALRTAARLVGRKMREGGPADIWPALEAEGRQAERFLHHYQERGAGAAWVSYYQGETDGYAEVMERLSGSKGSK